MSGLVARLSDAASIADQWGDPDVRDLFKEAAVEVERLRAQLAGADVGRAMLHAEVERLASRMPDPDDLRLACNLASHEVAIRNISLGDERAEPMKQALARIRATLPKARATA